MENLVSSLIGSVSDGLDQAVKDVRVKADGAKAGVADGVNDLATALHKASKDLRAGSAQERAVDAIANGLSNASNAIRDANVGQIVYEASRAVRTNPALLLGCAAMLGLAVSRFIKASGRQQTTITTDRGPEEAGLSQSQSMILGLLAIASGATLGSVLPHSRIEDSASDKVDDSSAADFKRRFFEESDASTLVLKNSSTPAHKSEQVPKPASARNLPPVEAVGIHAPDAPGPETENAFYRGTVNADS